MFSGKGQIWEILHGVRKIFGNRGESETGEMHHYLRESRGMDASDYHVRGCQIMRNW